MGLDIIFFMLLSVVIVVTSVMVIVFRNPVYSAISLIGTFLGLAGMYVLLNASFLALIQVMVYAGAIMVLFLFVIMLLNLSDKELGDGTWTVTRLVSAVMVLFILAALVAGIATLGQESPDGVKTRYPGLSRVADVPRMDDVARMTGRSTTHPDGTPVTLQEREQIRDAVTLWDWFGSVEAVGLRMFTKWLLVFEITGVLLLAAVIGAVVMAKRRL
ncbi:MAG: NADH-quinone oxidoreductase subunit J [Myxococcota bacterium]